jgi:hypothetical protein
MGFGQNTIKLGENFYNEDSKGVVYSQELSADLNWYTNGYSAGVNVGRLKNYYLTNYFQFSLGQLKHRKEFRQNFDFAPSSIGRISNAFVFGKQNSLFVVRANAGQKRYLSEKEMQKGISIGVNYSGGLSLGLLKPYYLDLIYFKENNFGDIIIRSEKYSAENAEVFLANERVYGTSPFAKGIGETQIVPGINGRAGVLFSWGAFDDFVKALEVGIMFDLFFGDIPIMVEDPRIEFDENVPYFLNLYVNLQLGKRK